MATATEQAIQQVYIGLLGRSADPEGLDYWASEIDGGTLTLEQLRANIVNEQAEYAAGLGSLTRTQTVEALYQSLFERAAGEEGLEYWVVGGGASVNTDQLVLALIDGASPADTLTLDNKTTAAIYYTDNTAQAAFTLATATASVVGVDDTAESIAVSQAATDANGGSTFYLSTGADTITGTGGDDMFIARGNSSLDNADILDGGAGTDTVVVMVDSGETAESPLLTNIEILEVQGQANNGQTGDNDVEAGAAAGDNAASGTVTNDGSTDIDAGDMVGVREFWSDDSRSDVVIEDVRRDTTETTIGFRSSDPGDVDLGVYFSQDNIVNLDATGVGGQITIDVADLEKIADDGGSYANAVADFPYETLAFNFADVNYAITYETSDATDHVSLAAKMGAALVNAAVLDNDLIGTGETVDLSVLLQAQVSGAFNFTDKNGNVRTNIPSIVIDKIDTSSEGSFSVGDSQWIVNGAVPGSTNYATDINDVPVVTLDTLTQTDIILDYVGRGSKSGDVEIGSMSLTDYSGSAGIEQFNVDVDRNSWIDSLQSTNNTLEVVNVENIGANGSLRIDGLTDVRVFDASTALGGLASDLTGMTGDITLTANLTNAVVDKYLNRQDDAADASADNSDLTYNLVTDDEFSYDLGDGNDTLGLTISAENFQHAGSTSHEDFVLEVNGNAGNDNLTLTIGGGAPSDWYDNQGLVDGLTINGNDGDDTITTPGTGNINIDGGNGSDTIYADNTGIDADWIGDSLDSNGDINNSNAIYAFNSVAADITDLESNPANNTVSAVNMAVAVTFKGYEVVVDLTETIGSLTNVAVDDLRINQAIKQAINNDAVLSKLLLVEDGPGRTLVVKSLIDGDLSADEAALDLGIDLLASTTALTASQVTAGVTVYTDALGTLDEIYQTSVFGDGNLDGADSTATSDNQINGGASDNANDVIVLGTGADSNDTVVYTGTNNATNFIVNFETTASTVATNTVVTPVGAVAESFTVTFADITVTNPAAASTITFDDSGAVAIDNIAAGLDNVLVAADVANAFAAGYTAGAGTNWTATYVAGTANVTFVATAGNPGDVAIAADGSDFASNANITSADTDTATISNNVDGVLGGAAAEAEVFTIDFAGTAVTVNGTNDISFDGTDVATTLGDGLLTVAAKVSAASYTNWTVVDNLDGTVTFTANATADFDQTALAGGDYTDSFGDGTAGIDAAQTVDNEGLDQVGIVTSVTTTTVDIHDIDYLDFSAYGVEGVFVDGVLIAGTDTNAAGELYIWMEESALNDGEYSIDVYSDDIGDGEDAADTLEIVVGVADFGVEQAFISSNFIIA